ncbi:MAG TPA: ABC transporter permease [bacterium]|nr:ABC transporter permease [bacterium]
MSTVPAVSHPHTTAPRAPVRALWWRVTREVRRNRLRGASAVVVVLVLLTALAAPRLAPNDPTQMNFGHFLEPPSWTHPLGTDDAGRDILSRVIYGARVSMTIGVLAVGLGAAGGVSLGLAAGYHGGAADAATVWLTDVLLSFPGILLALLIAIVLGAGLTPVIVAIGIASVPSFARLTRASVLSVRGREYVEASRAIGASDLRIIMRHVLLNSIGPILVYATLVLGRAILTAAALSFLGVGVPPPTPDWGAMVAEGENDVRTAPHVALFPGIAIAITVLAFNVLGDALRDALDPKT